VAWTATGGTGTAGASADDPLAAPGGRKMPVAYS
jgi:hypothetical protein